MQWASSSKAGVRHLHDTLLDSYICAVLGSGWELRRYSFLLSVFVILEQTTNDVILVNETALPVTIEEVFIGDKIANEKMEPYGFEYVHTVDSDVLRDYILEPNERIRRRFSVSRWRLFRVAFVTPEGKSTWYETNARAWGNRMSIEFTESTHREGGVLKSKASLLRNWFEQAQDSIPFISRWLD